MVRIEIHVKELIKQIKDIQINPNDYDNEKILGISQQLDIVISEFIRELKTHH